MMLCKWDELPDRMQTEEVRRYYDILKRKSFSLACKRVFDVVVSSALLVILSPLFLLIAAAIKLDSKGPVFFRQVRVTQFGREFRIHKFRSMCADAEKKGTLVTVSGDSRITKVGRLIRKCRLDEIPQLIDVFLGDMTFVGVRPEVPKYAAVYTSEMMATLLLPAGITNLASILFRNEAKMLESAADPDHAYIEKIMPAKMMLNLQGIEKYRFSLDVKLMIMTVLSMMGVNFAKE